MLSFLLVGASFIVAGIVGWQAYSFFNAGNIMYSIAFGVATLATVMMAFNFWPKDEGDAADAEFLIAEAEMFNNSW